MASHKFSEHLLKLSENKEDIEEAKKEWKVVCEQKLEEQTGICICQRKIKNVTSLFNTCTKETISVGTRCYTKFDFKAANLGQSMKKLIDMIREKGEYTFINDFNQYVLDNEELVIAHFQTEYGIHINSITELSILKENVYDLITDDGVLYLKDTFTAIDTRIKYLQEKQRQYALKRQEKERQDRQTLQEEKRKQEEKKKQEDQIKQVTKDYYKHYYNIQSLEQLNIAIEECKENIHLKEIQTTIQTRIHALQETERQEREEQRKREILREQQERESKQRTEDLKCQEEKIREQERQYYIQCACGLSYGQICKCKSPKYILSPSSDGQQYSCKTCKNWKDRCKK
jgi:hypothetical protein